jgi:hypothetical protein
MTLAAESESFLVDKHNRCCRASMAGHLWGENLAHTLTSLNTF